MRPAQGRAMRVREIVSANPGPDPQTMARGMTPEASPLSLLRRPGFRTIWLAAMASNLGHWIQTVAAAWLMTTLTASPVLIALVQSSAHLPLAILSLPAGVISDSYDRRKLLIFSQVLGLCVAVVMTVLAFLGLMTPWILLGLSFAVGCAMAIQNPPWQSSLVDFVGRENLPAAVGLNSMGVNAMRSLGPAIGGLVVAGMGAAVAFALNALSFCVLALRLLVWKSPRKTSELPTESFMPALSAGLRYASLAPNIQSVLLRAFVFGLSAVSTNALLPLVVQRELGLGALAYGLLLACFGVGAVMGALSNPRLRARYSGETVVRGGLIATGVAQAVIALVPVSAAIAPALALAGASWVICLNLFNVTVQLSTPRWVVGRTLAIYNTAVFGGMTLGSWLWGNVVETASIEAALLLAGAVAFVGAVLGLRFPLPEYAHLRLEPANVFRRPEVSPNILPRSGPIMIRIEFEVAPENHDAFLIVMAERRRLALRTGARNWSLLRDIENPLIWAEKYYFPTWTEYLRHHERRTKDDYELSLRMREVIEGVPQVRRYIERQALPDRPDHLSVEFH